MTPSPADVRAIVIGALLAMSLAALDQTIIAPALPPMARDLGDFDLLSWVVTAYLLSSAVVTPIVGKLSDLYGRRRLLALSLLTFMAGSALCALAPNMPILIVARALQGLGGGGLIPLAQTIIGDMVPPRERGRFAGYISVVWSAAAVTGPIVGGVVTERFGWAWIFWINLPLGLLALVITDRTLRRQPVVARKAAVDWLSSAYLSGFTISLLLVLTLGGNRLAWTSPMTLALASSAVLFGMMFAHQQTRASEPILPPRFLRDRVIRPVLMASFLNYGGYLAVVILAPIYFQVALATSVSEAGLLMIPLMLSGSLTANWAGHWSGRTARYKRPVLVGLPVTIAAMVTLAVFAQALTPLLAAGLFMIAGLGIGPQFPCSTVSVQNAASPRDLGAVSSALAFSRVLGASLAIAVMTALVLTLIARVLPDAASASSLEELAQRELPAEARHAVAGAFGIVFGVLAAQFALGLAVFALVEDRTLRGREPVPTTE